MNYTTLTGAFYVGNGWEWGLLGWLLIVSQWIIPENSLRLAPVSTWPTWKVQWDWNSYSKPTHPSSQPQWGRNIIHPKDPHCILYPTSHSTISFRCLNNYVCWWNPKIWVKSQCLTVDSCFLMVKSPCWMLTSPFLMVKSRENSRNISLCHAFYCVKRVGHHKDLPLGTCQSKNQRCAKMMIQLDLTNSICEFRWI
jgi:hypothetical protein